MGVKGMENWFALAFDTGRAGWKSGRAPFGQYNGEIPGAKGKCGNSGCYCGARINTLSLKPPVSVRGIVRAGKHR